MVGTLQKILEQNNKMEHLGDLPSQRAFQLAPTLSHASFPHLKITLSLAVFAAGAVFALFQKKMLSKGLSRVVAKIYFYPTFPFTVLMRQGENFRIFFSKNIVIITFIFSISTVSNSHEHMFSDFFKIQFLR